MPATAAWLLRPEASFRVVLSLTLLALAMALSLVAIAFVASFFMPTEGIAPTHQRVLAGNVGDFLINEPRYFAEGDFWLVRRPDGSFLAFHARDTRPWLIKG